MPQMAAVDFVSHEQDHALAASSELPLFEKEGIEVIGAECFPANAAPLLGGWGAAHKLGTLYPDLVAVGVDGRHRLNKTADGARGRALLLRRDLGMTPGPQHAKVFRVYVALALVGVLKVSLGRSRAQRLVACWAFGEVEAPDLEPLRRGVADDDSVVMAAAVVKVSLLLLCSRNTVEHLQPPIRRHFGIEKGRQSSWLSSLAA